MEEINNYKLIIGTISKDNNWNSKKIDTPVYFKTLEEVKEHLQKRKQEIQKQNRKIWFYKVWEFGKEDYIDMGENILN